MKISHLIHENALICDLKAVSKLEAIAEISRLFSDNAREVSEIQAALMAREALGPTLLPGTGVAVPHCRDPKIKDFYVGIGVSKKGIEEDSPLGGKEKTHLLVVIAAPPMKNEIMLGMMAALATHLKTNTSWIHDLINCSNPEKLRQHFEMIHTPSKLTLSHITQKPALTLTPNQSLQEAVALMVTNNLFYAPVVNEKGELLGEVTDRDILLFAVPDYILRMDNLLFVVEDDPFGKFLMRETETKVQDVLNKNTETLETGAPIIEAAHQMLTKGKRYLYLVNQGKLEGIITQKDLIRKILFA